MACHSGVAGLISSSGYVLLSHVLVMMYAMEWRGIYARGLWGTESLIPRSGYLLELGAFAGADLACEFPAASIMKVFTGLQRIDLSNNRITGK